MALLEFYGETCPHCVEMKPLVEKLEKELDIKVDAKEVWENEDNAKEQEKYDKGLCGGVPFFFNTESKKYLCGSTDYDSLKAWAKGE